jgi:hypothetical protein
MVNGMSNQIVVKTGLKAIISERGAVEMLRELIRSMGYEPLDLKPGDLQTVSEKLSQAAGKSPPWGWRYLHNILNRKIEASEKMTRAIMILGAISDGVTMTQAKGRPVQVLAVGEIKSGSVVFGSSRICANPACALSFVSDIWNKGACSPECSKIARKLRSNRKHI